MKYWKTALSILAALSASLALADDFKTINGKEYKNAEVSRVESDGIVLRTKSGISKVYFTELPKEVQERFHYDPEKAAAYSADQAAAYSAAATQSNAAKQSNASKTNGLTERVELKYDPPEQLTAAAHKAAQEKMFSPDEETKALAEVPAGGTIVVSLFSIISGAADPKLLTYVITNSSGKVLDRRRGNSALPINQGSYQWVGIDQIDLPAFEDSLRVRVYHELSGNLGDYIITRNGQLQRVQ